jgi:hypothetical protein
MKFKVVLWYMARRMELLARTHPEFISRLQGRKFVLQISTDEGSNRYFRIYHNRVLSRGEIHEEPSLTLHFKTDEAAFKLIAGGDANAFMAGVQTGDVKIIGDYALLMWFMSVGKYLKPSRPKKGHRSRQARIAALAKRATRRVGIPGLST